MPTYDIIPTFYLYCYIIIGGHGEGATAYPLDKNIIITSVLDKYADLKHPNAIENEATKKSL